eukprot:13637878-Alexandrium_andersonii.AAC.1
MSSSSEPAPGIEHLRQQVLLLGGPMRELLLHLHHLVLQLVGLLGAGHGAPHEGLALLDLAPGLGPEGEHPLREAPQ